MALLWFHATKRPSIEDYLSILRSGCRPAPVRNNTQQLELELEIAPPRVYCYLGRTREQFGEFCIVFEPDGVPSRGEMCPFDSGGLVHQIPPVSDWSPRERQAYLEASSFAISLREECIAAYPADLQRSYLNCDRPPHSGPHEIWNHVPEADIWRQGTHWRAWTWEGRWEALPVGDNVRAWTCSPALLMQIVEAIEANADLSTAGVDAFLERYREGGVGALIADLLEEQEL